MLIVIFGLAGSGKTYVGEWLAQQYGLHFEDADQWLTDEMREFILAKKPFTQVMRDNFVSIVISHIQSLSLNHKHLVISQGFYKDSNRQKILSAFPDAVFFLIESAEEMMINRLKRRGHVTTLEYAQQIASLFEAPTHEYFKIDNSYDNNDAYLSEQFAQYPILKTFFPKRLSSDRVLSYADLLKQTGSPILCNHVTILPQIPSKLDRGDRSHHSMS